MREVTRLTGLLWRTLITALVVTGVQWAIVSHAGDVRAVLVALGVPALFAGATVARLLAHTTFTHSDGRGGGHR
jgi:hypothetical protein